MALTGLLMAASRVAGGVAKGRREGEDEAYTRREAEAKRAFDEWSKRRQLQQQDVALSQKAEIEAERLSNQRTLRDMQDKAALERAGLQREVDMFRARGQYGREGDQQAVGQPERIATERNKNQREMNDADNQTAIQRAMIAAAAAQARAAAAQERGLNATQRASQVGQMRDDFQKEVPVKSAQEIANITTQIEAGLAGQTAMDDLSIVYETIKLFDPNSAVREGEIRLFKDAASLPEQARRLVLGWSKGRQLTPTMRADIAALLSRKKAAAAVQVPDVQRRYGERLRRMGAEADSAFVAPSPFPTSSAAPAGSAVDALRALRNRGK